ncbi:hypothetical protein ERY430_70048 [Erythrobacter sp. EC-HK427]|nr:hypothetical protein ERY430_70048 [Erythrobacter sp. EC-HK427]
MGFTRPRSSCWPCNSTSAPANCRSKATPTGWSFTNALEPPSAFTRRRMMSGSPGSRSTSASASASAIPPGMAANSKVAATLACSSPARTSPLSARAPSTKPSASSRIDLPAPVSPVSTPSPCPKDRSSASISTILRMESEVSMAALGQYDAATLRATRERPQLRFDSNRAMR